MKIILLIFCLATHLSSSAQKNINFGFHVGIGEYKIYGNESFQNTFGVKYGFLPGWSAGIDLKKRLSNKLNLFLQLNYENKGTRVTEPLFTDVSGQTRFSAKVSLKTSFIVLPILFKYNLTSGNNSLYMTGGPYLGFLMKSQQTVTDIEPYEDIIYEENLAYYNRVEFGLNLGIGYDFPLSTKQKLFIELRGATGLTNLNKSSFRNEITKNGGIQFILGTMF